MKTICALSLVCCLLSLVGATAQEAAPAPASPAVQSTPAATAAGPTTEYTLPPDKLAKAKALYDLRGRLRIIGTVWSLVVLLGMLYLGVMARYRDWAEGVAKNSFVQALIAVPLFLLTTDLLGLPLDAYQHSVSRQYGLSVQSWGSWFADQLKGEALGLVLGTFLLWLMIVIIRRSPRRWWFYFWFPLYAMFLLVTYGAPWVIDPLFNDFVPLDKNNPQLVRQIEKLSQRSGLSIPRSRMFEMDASKKTNELDAYVTGFGASKRIVVWDTTIQKMTTPETLFVVGHEMGHYVLNHIIYGLMLGAIGIFILLYLIYRVSGWMLGRFGPRWRIRALGDWAALPMIFLIFSLFGFFAAPVANSISRQFEHNADVYGLEVTHGINANSQESGAHAFQVLGEISLVYPYPSRFVTFWYGSHPSIPDRVRFAHEYDPWSKGEPPKYVK
ncbi:MAG TPA: M48 family metallopeptidase [Candidatus Angelobacter sp.]